MQIAFRLGAFKTVCIPNQNFPLLHRNGIFTPTRSNVKCPQFWLIFPHERFQLRVSPYLFLRNEHILRFPWEYNNKSHAVTPPVRLQSRILTHANLLHPKSTVILASVEKSPIKKLPAGSVSSFPPAAAATDTYKLDFRQRQQDLKDTQLSGAGIKSLRKISQINNVACK